MNSFFYKTLNPIYESKDTDLLIYSLLNNKFDIQKTIVEKSEEISKQPERQISFPALANEHKHQIENQRVDGLEKKQNQSKANFLSFYIRNHLNQQQKDADKLFLKQNVKFNETVTEIPKRSMTLTKNSGLKSESDKNHFVTSNLNNFNKNQDNLNLRNKLINRNKNLSESNQNAYRGKIYFQFEKKTDTKTTKRSTSTLGSYFITVFFGLN